MENTLDTYLRYTKTPALHIARAAGVSAPYICDLRYGRRKPSPAVAARIEDATGGAVPARGWGA